MKIKDENFKIKIVESKISPEEEKHKARRMLELNVWLMIGVLVSFFSVWSSSFSSLFEIFNNFYLLALFLVLPIIFKLIFDKLPFEFLRDKSKISDVNGENENGLIENIEQNSDFEFYGKFKFEIENIKESRQIAEKIFNRSGVYLLVGCIIAFSGILLFYSPYFQTVKVPTNDIYERVLNDLPRFGSLFFIELVAFFFLKQYRIMLEEYRFYESIKRQRQDNLTFLKLVEKYETNENILNLLLEKNKFQRQDKLLDGETTEILETQKLVNQDLDLILKLNELIKTSKSS